MAKSSLGIIGSLEYPYNVIAASVSYETAVSVMQKELSALDTRKGVETAMNFLNETERVVVIERCKNLRSFCDIEKYTGVSRTRASRVFSKAIFKLSLPRPKIFLLMGFSSGVREFVERYGSKDLSSAMSGSLPSTISTSKTLAVTWK